ncbi:hypothetical protein F2Q68_00011935 [Brassica cretica]|uniref:Uncharacterized protein n=1 Tax=Brassica cretica TaxID=69181 RepID=A0A8S9KMD4_BRACR|nr:hypothetical protein F2Q68_00011935 [Brassica cretica]
MVTTSSSCLQAFLLPQQYHLCLHLVFAFFLAVAFVTSFSSPPRFHLLHLSPSLQKLDEQQ